MSPGTPREPKPRPANPEPQISYIPPTPRAPGPFERAMLARLVPPTPPPAPLLGRGGCAFCGNVVTPRGASACVQCRAHERAHRQRMNALAEREAELRIKILEKQLTEGNTAS